MKKVYLCIALCVMLLAALSINAQRNMFVRGDNGSVNAVEVSNVDYATIHKPPFSFSFYVSPYNTDSKITPTSITWGFTYGLRSTEKVKTLSTTAEMGVCYSSENSTPTVSDNCLFLGTEWKSYTFTIRSLSPGTTYYFRPFVKLANTVLYWDFTYSSTTYEDHSCSINGHWFVDLGLPSGTLWAETNVGAETAADPGDHFAWGETTTKETYNWDNYRWGTSKENLTKYYKGDGKTTLEAADDAATANWGEACRMPTTEEFEELIQHSTKTYTSKTTSSGTSIKGWEFRSNENGLSIFLPISGYIYTPYWSSTSGHYMTSEIVPGDLPISYTYLRSLLLNHTYSIATIERYKGLSIRPVAKLE